MTQKTKPWFPKYRVRMTVLWLKKTWFQPRIHVFFSFVLWRSKTTDLLFKFFFFKIIALPKRNDFGNNILFNYFFIFTISNTMNRHPSTIWQHHCPSCSDKIYTSAERLLIIILFFVSLLRRHRCIAGRTRKRKAIKKKTEFAGRSWMKNKPWFFKTMKKPRF